MRGLVVLFVGALSLQALHPTDKPARLVRERLDAAAVQQHLETLATTATQVEVRVKDAVARISEATTESLAEVGRRFVAGKIVAVQIRFFEHDDWWSETLMPGKTGYRLVRMREGT